MLATGTASELLGPAPAARPRVCAWCRSQLAPTARGDARTCSRRCRQAVWRLEQRRARSVAAGSPRQLVYADPPYPGLAARYYGGEDSYAGEVDHAQLVASLIAAADGWALSTSAAALGDVLSLLQDVDGWRVCAWCKPRPTYADRSLGIHSCWEPLIVRPARRSAPAVSDTLTAHAARGEGDLIGRKPQRFVAWLLDLLGADPALDELGDWFPGSGIVGRSWLALGGQLSPRTWTARRSEATRPPATTITIAYHQPQPP